MRSPAKSQSLPDKPEKTSKNCLSCKLYLDCKDKKKSWNYVCGKFRDINAVAKTSKKKKKVAAKPEKSKQTIIIKKKRSKADTYDFEDVVGEVLDHEKISPLPRDLRIDDRDLPQAPNFFTFATSNKFLNIEPYPFARQLEIGTKLFAEWCPRCSDPDYIEDVPVKDRPDQFFANVQLLKFGKCPKCKGTKSEFYCEGELKVPCELAGLAGQRCVSGDTVVATEFGPLTFKNLASMHKEVGDQLYVGPRFMLENGHCVKPALFYITAIEPLLKLELANGYTLKARSVHPVMTQRGWVWLRNLTKKDVVACTGRAFDYISKQANPVAPPTRNALLKDADYFSKNLIWVSIKSVTCSEPEETYDVMIPDYHRFIGNGIVNSNSSKSQSFAMFDAYHLHTYLKNPSPQKMYGLLPMTDLHGMFTALTWQKAKDLLFDPIMGYVFNSPAFKQTHELLDHYGQKLGEELYQVKPTYYRYRHRSLFGYPVGPDKNKMRGTTAFQGGIDEIGLFGIEENSQKVKMNAEEVYTSVRNSFKTLKSKYYKLLRKGHSSILPPLMGCISSPLNKKDMIVKLYNRSLTSKTILGYHLATWEFNPNITRKDLQEDFDLDPIKAMRDYGAVPPNSSLPFIENVDQITPIIDFKRRNSINLSHVTQESRSGNKHRTGKLIFRQPQDGNKRILSIDAGQVSNSFALTTGFFDTELNRPVFDSIVELQPALHQSINFSFVYEDIICPIIEHMNIQLMVVDRWQSTKIRQDVEAAYGIETEQYSVKYNEFVTFKNDLQNGEMSIPKPELSYEKIETVGEETYPGGFISKPISHLIFQLLTVQDTGKEVMKGDGTTDDILRSMILAYSYLIDTDYRAHLSGVIHNGPQVQRQLGVVGLYSAGPSNRRDVYGIGTSVSRGSLRR